MENHADSFAWGLMENTSATLSSKAFNATRNPVYNWVFSLECHLQLLEDTMNIFQKIAAVALVAALVSCGDSYNDPNAIAGETDPDLITLRKYSCARRITQQEYELNSAAITHYLKNHYWPLPAKDDAALKNATDKTTCKNSPAQDESHKVQNSIKIENDPDLIVFLTYFCAKTTPSEDKLLQYSIDHYMKTHAWSEDQAKILTKANDRISCKG